MRSLLHRSVPTTVLVLAATMLLTACDSSSPAEPGGEDTEEDAVCGLVDPELLSEVFGGAGYRSAGSGVAGPEQRRAAVDCSVRSQEPPRAAVDLLVVEIPAEERAAMERRLTDELQRKSADRGLRCSTPEALRSLGRGYVCLDDSAAGPHNLRVRTDERLISVQLNRVELEDPVDAMVRLAAGADESIDAYDRAADAS
jgi:hypothetical protein